MNEAEKIALSERVASKYDVEANSEYVQFGFKTTHTGKWLADDSGRCAELAWENHIEVEFMVERDLVHTNYFYDIAGECMVLRIEEQISDHSSIVEATRIAILKCLDKMRGE